MISATPARSTSPGVALLCHSGRSRFGALPVFRHAQFSFHHMRSRVQRYQRKYIASTQALRHHQCQRVAVSGLEMRQNSARIPWKEAELLCSVMSSSMAKPSNALHDEKKAFAARRGT
jgi:hypothetical protein